VPLTNVVRFPAHNEMRPRQVHIYVAFIHISGAMGLRPGFNGNPAGHHASVEFFQFGDTLADIRLQRVRAFHIMERNFERSIHWRLLHRQRRLFD
jgi:hypothetical protein